MDYEIMNCELETDRSYTAQERTVRDRFVEEYLYDHDAELAAQRVGFPRGVAREYGLKFLEEVYVAREIKRRQLSIPSPDQSEEDRRAAEVQARQQIMASLWRESNYHGPGSSQSGRVAALARLSAMYGFDAPTRTKTEVDVNGGEGVFVIPGVVTADQWEKMAQAQQDQLTSGIPAASDTKH